MSWAEEVDLKMGLYAGQLPIGPAEVYRGIKLTAHKEESTIFVTIIRQGSEIFD